MTVNPNDYLARILDDTSDNRRDDIWLWYQLKNNHAQSLGEFNNPGMRAIMRNITHRDPDLAKVINNKKSEQLLPAKYFDWIDEGKRQIEWLISKIEERIDTNFLIQLSTLSGKDWLIASIDLWNAELIQKELLLNHLMHSWTAHKKGDKPFQWFKNNEQKEDEQKCSLAGKWLNNNIDGLLILAMPATTNSSLETYEDLLIFFDRCTKDQKTLYIDKIKKSWSQQKYRQSLTGKAQYNFILSDKAIQRLDKFADDHDLSRARILDILLKMEAEKNLYIPEMLKRLKDGF